MAPRRARRRRASEPRAVLSTADGAEGFVALCYERLSSAGGNPLLLDEPCRSIVLADTAHGLICNGGAEYFFAADFPGQPEYSVFVQAFRNLGLTTVADGLGALVDMFPFPVPHTERALRLSFLGAPSAGVHSALERFNQLVWADTDFDERLQAYYSRTAP